VYRLGGGVPFFVLEHELEQAGDGDGPFRDVLEGEVGGEEAVVGVLYGLVEVCGRQARGLRTTRRSCLPR
jgi:hypothetical protein